MTLIIPPGFGSAAIVMTSTEGTPVFVTTVGVDLSAVGGDFVAAANNVFASFTSTLGITQDSSITVDRVTLAVGDDGPGGSVDSTEAPIVSGRSGSMVPVSMAAIARKSTNVLGRRGRGRMFLPGVLTQTEVTEGGQISTTRQGTLQPILNDFYDALVEGTTPHPATPPVLLHSQAPASPTPIEAFTLTPLVGWMRGRIT